MKKLTKILSFALAFVCLSLCFVGCSLGDNPELSSIDLSSPLQSEFCLGETLDLTGKKLTLTYSDDSQKEIQLTESMFISKLDTTSATTTQPRTMVIEYKEKTVTSNYTVVNAQKVGSYRLYFDRAYVMTSVEKFKNNVSLGLDTDFPTLGSKLIMYQNGTAKNTDSDDSVLATATWSINTSNTITVTSPVDNGAPIVLILQLTENGFMVVHTESASSPNYSTYDTMIQTFTLQNA